MSGVIKRKFGHRDVHTGRVPCEHEGRDQGDVSISHKERPRMDLFFTVLRRNQPCQRLDFELLDSIIVR